MKMWNPCTMIPKRRSSYRCSKLIMWMQRAAAVLLLVLLSGCVQFSLEYLDYIVQLGDLPQGSRAEQVTSPSGRYTAQLWRCCDVSNYISGFDVFDNTTEHLTRQHIDQVPGLVDRAGGVYFEWTPSENYLVIITDNRATSHGCDELLVYSGDGSELVYSSVPTSICTVLMGDVSLSVVALCQNDDILLSDGVRRTPSTGEGVHADTCAD